MIVKGYSRPNYELDLKVLEYEIIKSKDTGLPDMVKVELESGTKLEIPVSDVSNARIEF